MIVHDHDWHISTMRKIMQGRARQQQTGRQVVGRYLFACVCLGLVNCLFSYLAYLEWSNILRVSLTLKNGNKFKDLKCLVFVIKPTWHGVNLNEIV